MEVTKCRIASTKKSIENFINVLQELKQDIQKETKMLKEFCRQKSDLEKELEKQC